MGTAKSHIFLTGPPGTTSESAYLCIGFQIGVFSDYKL